MKSKVNSLVELNISYFCGILGREETLELIRILKLDQVPRYVIENVAKDVRITKTKQYVRVLNLLTSPKKHWRKAVASKFQKHIDNEKLPY